MPKMQNPISSRMGTTKSSTVPFLPSFFRPIPLDATSIFASAILPTSSVSVPSVSATMLNYRIAAKSYFVSTMVTMKMMVKKA